MKKIMKNKGNYFYLGTLLFFLIILSLCPIAGDDWGNYIVGKTGLVHSIGNAVGMYFDWEGRFVGRILINILTYHKVLFNIINSVIITSIVYFIVKFINPKHKKVISILSLLIILLMNIFTFSQTITWVAGSITYLFVIPVMLSYFYFIINHDKYNKYITGLLIFSSLIMTMFVENMSVVLIVGDILILISKYIKNKKIDYKMFSYLIISIIGFIIMFLAPGNSIRNGVENIDFNKLSFIKKISYNIPNFINYTFIVNGFLLILLCFSNYYLIKKYIKNNYIKVVVLIYMLFIPLISIITYPMVSFGVSTSLSNFIDSNNILVILYWISYLIIFGSLVVIDSLKDKQKLSVFFMLLGLCSNGIMLMSPTWGFRTSLFTYIALSISSLIVIDKYVKIKKLDVLLEVLLIPVIIYYLVLYTNVRICQNDLERSIKKQIKEDKDVIEILQFPVFSNCNINPTDEFHLAKFKEYYGIDKNKSIKFSDKWKFVIIYKGE